MKIGVLGHRNSKKILSAHTTKVEAHLPLTPNALARTNWIRMWRMVVLISGANRNFCPGSKTGSIFDPVLGVKGQIFAKWAIFQFCSSIFQKL